MGLCQVPGQQVTVILLMVRLNQLDPLQMMGIDLNLKPVSMVPL